MAFRIAIQDVMCPLYVRQRQQLLYCPPPALPRICPPYGRTDLERQEMEVHVHRVCRGGQALRDAGGLSAA